MELRSCEYHHGTSKRSILVQEMVWCHQATNQYLNQRWLRSVFRYDSTRPDLDLFKCTRSSELLVGNHPPHYHCVIMIAMASQITGVTSVYSTVCWGADQRNIKDPRHWPLCGEFTGVNSLHKWPVTRIMFPFDDVIISVSTGNDDITTTM